MPKNILRRKNSAADVVRQFDEGKKINKMDGQEFRNKLG